jgi:hypothetical protein
MECHLDLEAPNSSGRLFFSVARPLKQSPAAGLEGPSLQQVNVAPAEPYFACGRLTRQSPLARSAVRLGDDRGRIRRSQRARSGGPTCWLTREQKNEIGAPIMPSGRTPIDSPTSCAPVVLVTCSKCDWRAAFSRDELIASHGATCAMPSLLNELSKPGCVRLANQWDRCGVYYVEPIGGLSQTKRK